MKALRSDPRTDVGQTLRELSVARHDRTGRAELISIVGDHKREISGWEFKLILGRALGWSFFEEFTIHCFAIWIGICISRWWVRTRSGPVPGGIARDGPKRTILSTNPGALFSRH